MNESVLILYPWLYILLILHTIHLQGFLLNGKCGDDYANFCVHLCNSISTLACTANYGDTVKLYFSLWFDINSMGWHNFRGIVLKVGHEKWIYNFE